MSKHYQSKSNVSKIKTQDFSKDPNLESEPTEDGIKGMSQPTSDVINSSIEILNNLHLNFLIQTFLS